MSTPSPKGRERARLPVDVEDDVDEEVKAEVRRRRRRSQSSRRPERAPACQRALRAQRDTPELQPLRSCFRKPKVSQVGLPGTAIQSFEPFPTAAPNRSQGKTGTPRPKVEGRSNRSQGNSRRSRRRRGGRAETGRRRGSARDDQPVEGGPRREVDL